MKILNAILLLQLIVSPLFSQNQWMTRNLINVPLEFRMHKDSIDNLHKIIDGKIENNGRIYYLADSLDGIPSKSNRFEQTSKFLLISGKLSAELYIILDFVFDRLYEINIYSNDPYYLNNIYLELNKHFKSKGDRNYYYTTDSTMHFTNYIVSYGNRYSGLEWRVGNNKTRYFFEYNILDQSGYISISDKKLIRKFPTTCGSGFKKSNSWIKLEAYLEKKHANK